LAILAREAGVPTVVALSGATSTVEDGQAVEVDGDAGTLRPVEEDP
jgi:pyruvate,water dikinase